MPILQFTKVFGRLDSCLKKPKVHQQLVGPADNWRSSKSGQIKRKRSVTRQSASTEVHSKTNTAEGCELYPPRALRPERIFTPAGWVAFFGIVAMLAGFGFRLLQVKKEDQAVPDYQDEFMHSDHHDQESSPEFQVVLATVRQNVIFQRALQSLREGDNSRAMVELHRMLDENSKCRKPLNLDAYTEQDREDVYRLHLQNSELPQQYSTLLHLRQVLHVADKRAEALEKSLGSSAYDFSI